jgi:hypothetical protein
MARKTNKRRQQGGMCPKGFRWNEAQKKCIPLAEYRATLRRRCPNGFKWDNKKQDCVPKNKAPVTDPVPVTEPVVDETEEPVTEETVPVPEKPVTEEPVPVPENPVTEEPVPVPEEPVTEEPLPVSVEAKPDETKQETPVVAAPALTVKETKEKEKKEKKERENIEKERVKKENKEKKEIEKKEKKERDKTEKKERKDKEKTEKNATRKLQKAPSAPLPPTPPPQPSIFENIIPTTFMSAIGLSAKEEIVPEKTKPDPEPEPEPKQEPKQEPDPETKEAVPVTETKEKDPPKEEAAEPRPVIEDPNPSGIEVMEPNEPIEPLPVEAAAATAAVETTFMSSFFSPKKEEAVVDEKDDDDDNDDDDDDEDDDDDDDDAGGNKDKFRKEREENNYWKEQKDPSDAFLYPDINDPNFNIKIASKKEFQNHKYDGTVNKNIAEQADKECETSFEILPHQQFLRNFMSMTTPYNSLLLYHELGTGKTCSAIGITEEMRTYMKQTGVSHKILIVASPNVQENFQLQLFDPSKLVQQANGSWSLNTCAGNNFLKEINPTNVEGMGRDKIISMIRGLIKKYYSFMGYEQVSLHSLSDEKKLKRREKMKKGNNDKSLDGIIEENIPEIIDLEPIQMEDNEETREMKRKLIKRLKDLFDNRLMVIDEVHNMLSRTEDERKSSSKILSQIVRYCENTRFLFLSATPLYNSDKEITWLVNMMNMNDKRATVKHSQLFDKNGNFTVESKDATGKVIRESGRDLLRRKLIGYVSYVRGENPYTFPYRIYPKDFAEPENLLSSYTYPVKRLNGSALGEDPSKHVLANVFMNKMGTYQQFVYNAVIDKLLKNETFSQKESFGFQDLIVPLSILNMSYPTAEMDKFIAGDKEAAEAEVPYKGPIQPLHGKEGLANVMTFERVPIPQGKTTVPVIQNFEYNEYCLGKYGRLFHPDNIGQFSPKIHAICRAIQESTGIVLIYSKYIEGGLLPMALALEEMGLSRYCYSSHVKSFLKTKQPALDPLTMKPKTDTSVLHAKYVMITGTKMFSPDNAKDLEMVFHPENKDGRFVKVVMISQAGSEGIDFKCIRQVHILDPWYNMSRIEQIIGRAVRTKSHCQLPFSQRNVEIYMHGTMNGQNEKETADMYMYRLAEKKAIQIGQITRILKESAVDCLLNMDQNNFTEENMDTSVELELSTKTKKIQFKVGDKAFSSKCDYMESCEYQCVPFKKDIKPEENSVTYNIHHLRHNHEKIGKRLRQLFRDHAFYKRDKLIQEIQIGKPYPIQEIYYTLGVFLKNKDEWLVHKGRSGHLIRKQDLYTFQPSEITDKNASVYDRTVPLDYKPRDFVIKLPDENEVPILPDKNSPVVEIVSSAAAAAPGEKASPRDALPKVNSSFHNIETKMEAEAVRIMDDMPYVHKTSNKYNEYAKMALHILEERHHLKRNDIMFHLVFHMIECLSYSEKCICFEALFKSDADFNKKTVQTFTNVHDILYAYFHDCIIKDKDVTGIYIGNETSNELYIWKEKTWKHGKDFAVECGKLTDVIKTRFYRLDEVLKKTLNELSKQEGIEEIMIGYISFIPKDKSFEFKAKDIFQIRNSLGSRCDQEPKPMVIKRINYFLSYLEKPEDERYADKTEFHKNAIHKPITCIIYEIMLRHHTKTSGEVWFLSLQESLLSPPKFLAFDKKKSDWTDVTKKKIK